MMTRKELTELVGTEKGLETLQITLAVLLGYSWFVMPGERMRLLAYAPPNTEYRLCTHEDMSLSIWCLDCPNWPKDLNACQTVTDRMVKGDLTGLWPSYLAHLWEIVHPDNPQPNVIHVHNYLARNYVNATAVQRTIALILTLQHRVQ